MWKTEAKLEWDKLQKSKLAKLFPAAFAKNFYGKWNKELEIYPWYSEFKQLFFALKFFQYDPNLTHFSWNTNQYYLGDYVSVLKEYLSETHPVPLDVDSTKSGRFGYENQASLLLQCDGNTIYITKEDTFDTFNNYNHMYEIYSAYG